jgi:hypothetical protein
MVWLLPGTFALISLCFLPRHLCTFPHKLPSLVLSRHQLDFHDCYCIMLYTYVSTKITFCFSSGL